MGWLKTLRSASVRVTACSRDSLPASTASMTVRATQSLETLCWGKGRSPCTEAIQPVWTSMTAIPTARGKPGSSAASWVATSGGAGGAYLRARSRVGAGFGEDSGLGPVEALPSRSRKMGAAAAAAIGPPVTRRMRERVAAGLRKPSRRAETPRSSRASGTRRAADGRSARVRATKPGAAQMPSAMPQNTPRLRTHRPGAGGGGGSGKAARDVGIGC